MCARCHQNIPAHHVQVVARCKEDILKAKGVKPTLSPNLDVLATVEALDVKKLLFIGVGCQVRSHSLIPGAQQHASLLAIFSKPSIGNV